MNNNRVFLLTTTAAARAKYKHWYKGKRTRTRRLEVVVTQTLALVVSRCSHANVQQNVVNHCAKQQKRHKKK